MSSNTEPKLFITSGLVVAVNNGQQDGSTSGVVKVPTPNKFPLCGRLDRSTSCETDSGCPDVFSFLTSQEEMSNNFTVVAININGGT